MQHHSLIKSLLARKVAFGATLGGAVLFMVIGVILWGGFNTAMEATNTMEFCITCHEMRDNVYVEYLGSAHDGNRSGVRAGCPDCHVPRPWVHKMVRKVQASQEVWHKLMGTVDTPEKFDEQRLVMAKRVWQAMKDTDSRECRNCHDWHTMNPERQKPRARNQHKFAMENGRTCIDCHKGIAHQAVHNQLSEEELETISAPVAAHIQPVPQSFLEGLIRVEAAEKAAEAQAQAEVQRDREQRAEAKLAEQRHIEEAVAKALAERQAATQDDTRVAAAPVPATAPAAGGLDAGIDWSKAGERRITLFYPGQTSMEWTLVGKYHGGALPFKDGDRCFTCHDKETEAMGRKMVTGEKAEPTPIPGKRGSIPVSVQATHDADNLYLRFQWEDAGHNPVPFAEGGKLDPQHQVKLALMLATDDVIYAKQAGCWGTCHHDLRSMPEHPADPKASGLALDFSTGVTKYLKESRTAVEEKGQFGKKLGGWDKLKDSAALEAELSQGHFMDLLRVNSGDNSTEDGHILAERHMDSGQGFAATIQLDAGQWTATLKRPLKSDKPGDLTLEPGKIYNFGFAIHDDYSNARFHHVSLGYKLGFDSPEAEVNATAQ
jgi:cytochrome c-type protein NapC